ncbi:MAG: hypothetical protein IJC04_10940 [Oscillospiraceae bacterium]|nr:hypothetical protein [Oscillospiraceae bacterium]
MELLLFFILGKFYLGDENMTEASKNIAIDFYKSCEEKHNFSETIVFDAMNFLSDDFTQFWEGDKQFVIKAIEAIKLKDENAEFFIEMYGCDGEKGNIDFIYSDSIIIKTVLSDSEINDEFEKSGEDTFPTDVCDFTVDKSYHFINDDGTLSDFSEKCVLNDNQNLFSAWWD